MWQINYGIDKGMHPCLIEMRWNLLKIPGTLDFNQVHEVNLILSKRFFFGINILKHDFVFRFSNTKKYWTSNDPQNIVINQRCSQIVELPKVTIDTTMCGSTYYFTYPFMTMRPYFFYAKWQLKDRCVTPLIDEWKK